jgi:tetratricopeptide (TPR) repeat protein
MATDDTAGKLALLTEYRNAFWPDANDLHVLVTLGQSYQTIGCFAEAVKLFKEAAEADPESALPHVYLASAYEEQGRTEDAAFSYVEASLLDREDKHDAAYHVYELVDHLADTTKALDILRRILSRYPSYEYFKETLAEFCYRYGEYAEAEAAYRELLKKDGIDPERRLDWEWRLSGVLIDSGKYDEGFPLIERVLPQLGSRYDAENIERSLADDYLKAGRFKPALETYLHRAPQFLPGKSKAEMLRKAARCYEGLKQYDKAIECLVEILTFIREGGSQDDDWIAKKTVIFDPRFYEEIYAALTRNYEAKGDLFRAKETFKKEKEVHPRSSCLDLWRLRSLRTR